MSGPYILPGRDQSTEDVIRAARTTAKAMQRHAESLQLSAEARTGARMVAEGFTLFALNLEKGG